MGSCNLVLLAIFATIAISNAAPATGFEGILKIPDECKVPGFCSIKPEGYDQLEEKINSLLPKFLRELGQTSYEAVFQEKESSQISIEPTNNVLV